MKKLLFISVIFFLVSVSFTLADDIGTYRIPMKVRYADVVVDPGSYMIQIVTESEGPYIVLNKGGQVVSKDLAIQIPAGGSVKKPQVQIAKIAGQDFLRIRIRSGNMWYYAYMETKW
jgi:hypothetical protein